MSDELARKRFTEFKERGGQIPNTELDQFWTTLSPITIDEMIGEWKGGEFRYRSSDKWRAAESQLVREDDQLIDRRPADRVSRRRWQQVQQREARQG